MCQLTGVRPKKGRVLGNGVDVNGVVGVREKIAVSRLWCDSSTIPRARTRGIARS